MEMEARPERGRRKMALSLTVNHQETNGSEEGTLSPGQKMESSLKEVGFR